MQTKPSLQLNHFSFDELRHAQGLARLDQTFLAELQKHSNYLYIELLNYRSGNSKLSQVATSELLIHTAIYLEKFLAQLFNIQEEVIVAQIKTTSLNPISNFKNYFVLRKAKKEIKNVNSFPSYEDLEKWLQEELSTMPLQTTDKEMAVALLATQYLTNMTDYAAQIEMLTKWCARALVTPAANIENWVSFKLPQRIEYFNLVPTQIIKDAPVPILGLDESQWRLRDGFQLTDTRMNDREVQDEVNYCIYCHDHAGDFCSKGFPVKKGIPELGFKKNPLDVLLPGCPLEEKISEMNYLKKDGYTLAALAMVMIDNPMCPATGHRICNDCMKACIYQKQDPVNIPEIETRVLTDVLDLPWGVEIYDLLTRWNPLRDKQFVTKPFNGLKIMIAGMGPAGFTLAHHLLLEGFAVVGFDGLKIERLPENFLSEPIHSFKELYESLDERVMAGFGGVAEYGITVRWDKNFLKLIYLSLARRPFFNVFGGVRFGGTITVDDAWELGFDHFVVAVGAGLPKALSIPGSMAPGMRQANDFLMALQLGNAAKTSSISNLQIRLPAVVIGGGLTGVDTATELQAYYVTQVEKILLRHEQLVAASSEEKVFQNLNSYDKKILQEYLTHGQALRQERAQAKEESRLPNFIKLCQKWGGVSIAYRRSMQESPAYINNHEELQKALAEGIFYIEGVEPIRVELDEEGHCETLVCLQRTRDNDNNWMANPDEIRLAARSILVATGTQPNTAYEFEHKGTFNRLNSQYQHYEDVAGELKSAPGAQHAKEAHFGPFTSYNKNNKRVTLIGDTHPVFHGNVVKAIASGLRTYPKIVSILDDKLHTASEDEHVKYQEFSKFLQEFFDAKILSLSRKSKEFLELVVSAPLATKKYQEGQFYRLQNFEHTAQTIEHTLLQMDPLAISPCECDRKAGTLTFLIREDNANTKILSLLQKNEFISLMGPTGVRAKIPTQPETILIIGTVLSYNFLRSFGQAAKNMGNKIIYICLLNSAEELIDQSKLENASDVIFYLCKQSFAERIQLRPRDQVYAHQDIAKLIQEESSKTLLANIDRIYVIGGVTLLQQFQALRKDLVKDYLLKNPKVFASVYGNMQCMLKGVCAQCLQWQIDPETGQRTKAVFACSWQDQPLEIIDLEHMYARQQQNHLFEKLNTLWVEHVLEKRS